MIDLRPSLPAPGRLEFSFLEDSASACGFPQKLNLKALNTKNTEHKSLSPTCGVHGLAVWGSLILL